MKDSIHFACPHIDKVLQEIDAAQRLLAKINDCDDIDEIKELASRAETELWGTDRELEKVRSIAIQLRDARNGFQERVEELESEMETA